MISFADIQKANEQISTTEIKGKDYAEVNQRVKAFRMVYPSGFITTVINEQTDDFCEITASVGYYENGEPFVVSTGTAREERQSSYINKTSFVENCETSAVGRALGFAGFGIDTSICSAEELQNALDGQNKKPEGEQNKKPEGEQMADASEYKKVLKAIQAKTGEKLIDINRRIYELSGFTNRSPHTAEDFKKTEDAAREYLKGLK